MGTKEHVLTLLKREPVFFSGEKLAQQLGVSRTAIWKAIKELEKAGYHIERSTVGYRYQFSDVLNKEDISCYLKQSGYFLPHIQIADTSESTMKDAKMGALAGHPHLSLYIADMQVAARGRFQRPFFAKKHRGIYMSILLKPEVTFSDLPQYTVLAAVATACAIDELAGIKTEIKWVNDIYYQGKKICGILSEAISDFESGQISQVIIGMGINVSIKQDEFPEDLQDKVTSIFAYDDPVITRNQLIALIWSNFIQLLQDLPTIDYLSIYREKSFVLGKEVTFNQNGQEYLGTATAINDLGELIVQTNSGEKILSSGEISLSSIK